MKKIIFLFPVMVVKFFSENLAYLVWDQHISDKDGKIFLLSKDHRIMEKINGKLPMYPLIGIIRIQSLLTA